MVAYGEGTVDDGGAVIEIGFEGLSWLARGIMGYGWQTAFLGFQRSTLESYWARGVRRTP